MILVSVISSMGKDQIRLNTLLQRLEPELELLPLLWKKAISEGHYFDLSTSRFVQKVSRRGPRLTFTITCRAKTAPTHIKANTPSKQAQKHRSRSNLDVVRMRA